jgi:hypothetical protein
VIVLWVRSYSWKDRIGYSTNSIHLPVVSALGYVHFSVRVFVFPPGGPTSEGSWGIESSEITNKMRDTIDSELKSNGISFIGFRYYLSGNTHFVGVPYWFISILFALLCGLPWYWRRFNFSLRTFFIAFTVLAVLLGFIGWLTR